jgi:polyhydroxyalkanoate synthesis repressor PhaR
MSEPRLIKKYPNRRLYDTELSRYITIEDVRALINSRTRPRIIEQRSGADITRSVLLQVVAELELGDSGRLSENFLTALIRSYELTPAAAATSALDNCIARQLEPSAMT